MVDILNYTLQQELRPLNMIAPFQSIMVDSRSMKLMTFYTYALQVAGRHIEQMKQMNQLHFNSKGLI